MVLQATAGKIMDRSMMDAWFTLMCDLTDEQFTSACVRVAREHKYPGFPSAGVIYAAAQKQDGPAPEQRAAIAWRCVRDSISRHGGYRSVSFDDPVIHATIRAMMGSGGWPDLCDLTPDELKWREKDFLRLYPTFLGFGVSSEDCQPLHGLIARDPLAKREVTNVSTGLPSPQVKRIGHAPPMVVVANFANSFGNLPAPEAGRTDLA